ncbi:MAG: hypothetical protein ACE5IE_06585 [Dehalococcoidia bacterium]
MAEQNSMRDKRRIREGDFRHYVFAREEVLKGTEKWLEYVGYEVQPISPVGSVQPDFHAKRQADEGTYEVMGIVRESMDETEDALTELKGLKSTFGENADYVLVFPPINEYPLLEVLLADKGRLWYEFKDQDFMLWMQNPDDETTWCFVGAARDTRFNDYFVLSDVPIDFFISQRLTQLLLAEEEEE